MKKIKFILKGQIIFEAKNIDDAFEILEKHFYNLRTNPDYNENVFLPETNIKIKPIEKEDKNEKP